jgi:hypothetical protein
MTFSYQEQTSLRTQVSSKSPPKYRCVDTARYGDTPFVKTKLREPCEQTNLMPERPFAWAPLFHGAENERSADCAFSRNPRFVNLSVSLFRRTATSYRWGST